MTEPIVGGCVEPHPLAPHPTGSPAGGGAPRYPGARWYPGIGGNGGYCSARSTSWHEAVTTAGVDAVSGWASQEHPCHGFTAEDGDAGQWADFHESVNGTYQGNGEVITWENWDGLLVATGRSPDGSFGPNDRKWTAQQFERNADIAAWQVDGLGIPLHNMQNTEEPGHGPHRLGVPDATGNVQLHYGPTQWTMHRGKQCCGDLRILGLPAMLARAAVILAAVRAGRCTWLPTGPVNLTAALARTGTETKDWTDMATKEEFAAVVAPIRADVAALRAAVAAIGAQVHADLAIDTADLALQKEDREFHAVRANGSAAVFIYGDGLLSHVDAIAWVVMQRTGVVSGSVRPVNVLELDRLQAAVDPSRVGLAGKQASGVARQYPTAPPAYKVQPGDTLTKIAAAYKVTVAQLVAWNNLKNENDIVVGQVLVVSAPKV